MSVLYPLITVVTITANLGIGVAGMARAEPVVANAKAVGVAASKVPILGAIKVAGAVGLIVGLLGVQVVGLAAATGLVVFFVGAVVFHLRARVLHNIAFPGAFLGLAVATLLLALGR